MILITYARTGGSILCSSLNRPTFQSSGIAWKMTSGFDLHRHSCSSHPCAPYCNFRSTRLIAAGAGTLKLLASSITSDQPFPESLSSFSYRLPQLLDHWLGLFDITEWHNLNLFHYGRLGRDDAPLNSETGPHFYLHDGCNQAPLIDTPRSIDIQLVA